MSHFFVLNGIVVLCLILYLLRKAPRAGGRLRLQKAGAPSLNLGPPKLPEAVLAREVTVIFNYNGHSWEAYEVLGLAPGSSYEASLAAFEDLAAKSDDQSIPFLVAAIEAIREKQKL